MIKNELAGRIKKILEQQGVKDEGIRNVAQFVDAAVKEKIVELQQQHLSHVNCYDDHVRILDSKLEGKGRILSVHFQQDNQLYCDYCEQYDCVHVQYAWEIPEVRKPLEQQGLKPPSSRRIL